MNHFLSIGLPARNEEESVEQAIESIIKSTAWKRAGEGNRELIVCVNGSSDKTAQICRELGQRTPELRLIELKEAGKNNAINHIAKVANSKARDIYFSDADVITHRSAIERTLAELRANPQIKFAAPLCIPIESYIPPKRRNSTQALYVESTRFAKNKGAFQLAGQGYAANREFLLQHPLPNTNMIGDDRYIKTKFPHLIKMVYSAKFFYKTPSLKDHLRQRTRQKIQKRALNEHSPETLQKSVQNAKEVSPRRIDLVRALSSKARVGLALNQGAEIVATIKAKRAQNDVWPKIKSTKLRRRR